MTGRWLNYHAALCGLSAWKLFAFYTGATHSLPMTQPLALVLYEKLLPGTQLVNRLQDLKYRVQTVSDSETLSACADLEKPMLVFADLVSSKNNICDALALLRRNPATQHIPVIAFAPEVDVELHKNALDAGATLVVSEATILNHLTQFLEQALRVE